MEGGEVKQSNALNFMLAGNSEFILYSTKTQDKFRYTLKKKKANKESNNENEEYIYFLNMYNNGSMEYQGIIAFNSSLNQFKFYKGSKGLGNSSDVRIRSLEFVLNKLFTGQTVGNLIVYHVGKCGRCGKKLTDPESILTGLGPSCSKYMNVPRVKIKKS